MKTAWITLIIASASFIPRMTFGYHSQGINLTQSSIEQVNEPPNTQHHPTLVLEDDCYADLFFSEEICIGDSFLFVDTWLSATGTYIDTIVYVDVCDTIYQLDLQVLEAESFITETACNFYVSPSANYIWTSSGNYTDTLVSSAGCDSIIHVDLTINLNTSGFQSAVSCDQPYFWETNGQTYTESGLYNATLTNALGCDSTITLYLIVGNTSYGSENISACDAYTWPVNNSTYTESGEYIDTLTNASGCDSIVTLNLEIRLSSGSSQTFAACDSFLWEVTGLTYTESGSYNEVFTNAAECDSVVTLELTINESSEGFESISACDSYTWPADGLTYDQSGTYTTTLTNAAGCDSVITLELTINESTEGSEAISACDSHTWPADGLTYDQSGTYTTTLTNAAGCDSVITLELTINESSEGSEAINVCDSYTWPADGLTYDQSGTYTTTLTNAAGCDSLVTLELTINESSEGSEAINACDSYTWPADGLTYDQSGTYTTTLTNAAGCDSLVTLELTVNQSTESALTESGCETYMAPDGSEYSESGEYTAIIPNQAGCDSIISIDLTIINIDDGITQTGSTLTANATGDYTYQWYNCTTELPIDGADQITFDPTVNGLYQVEISDGTCSVFSECINVTNVGISENQMAKQVHIYPNPAMDQLFIETDLIINQITIFDLTGQQVLQIQNYQSKMPIDLYGLLPGVYFLQIQSDQKNVTSYRWIKS